MNNESSKNFFLSLFIAIFPVIPFTFFDIYYSYISSYICLDISNTLSMRTWLIGNGYMSLSSIIFIFFVFIIIYNNKCKVLLDFLQLDIFIKSYVFIKVIFNIGWTITGSILFYKTYPFCSFNLQFYIWFRIAIMFVFILISLKNIIHQNFNSIEKEIINTNA